MTPLNKDVTFCRFDSEREICKTLGEIGRQTKTHSEKCEFVSRFGLPWWIEPTQEFLELCPIRLRPKKEQ